MYRSTLLQRLVGPLLDEVYDAVHVEGDDGFLTFVGFQVGVSVGVVLVRSLWPEVLSGGVYTLHPYCARHHRPSISFFLPPKSDKTPKIAKMLCFGPQTLLQFTKNHYLCPGLHQWYVSHASIWRNPDGLFRSAALSSRLIRPSAQSSPVSNPPGEDYFIGTSVPYLWAHECT